MAPRIASDLIAEGHEDRIQRLEDNYPQLAASMAAAVVRIDNMDKSVAGVDKKMDEVLDAIKQHANDSQNRMATLAEDIQKHEQRIAPLKLFVEKRNRRWNILKKSSIPLLLAAAGAVAAKFGEQIYAWLVS